MTSIVVTPVKAALLQIFLAFHNYTQINRFAHAGETSRSRVVQETSTRTHQEQELSRAVQVCFVCNSAKNIGIPSSPVYQLTYYGVYPLDYRARLPIYEDGAKLAQSLPQASLPETTTGSYRYRMNCRLNLLWPNPVDVLHLPGCRVTSADKLRMCRNTVSLYPNTPNDSRIDRRFGNEKLPDGSGLTLAI